MEKKPISKLVIINLILSFIPLLITNIIAVIAGIVFLFIPGLRGKLLALLSIIIGSLITLLVLAIIDNSFGGSDTNDISAIGTLKLLASVESIWRAQNPDENDKKDYWTYDVSCLHRMMRADGLTKIAYIPMDMARADVCPAPFNRSKFFGDSPLIETWVPNAAGLMAWPKSGYWLRAMLADENNIPYNQNKVGSNNILATNDSKYAFVSYPDTYGYSGFRTFIVNELNTIYGWDSKSDENKVVLQWPNLAKDTKWEVVD